MRSIVDAYNGERLGPGASMPAHDAEQAVVADWQHEPLSEPGTGPATQRQAEMMDNLLQPARAAGTLGQHRAAETLGKDLASAARHADDAAPS